MLCSYESWNLTIGVISSSDVKRKEKMKPESGKEEKN